jgi:hypothetical protein
MSTACVRRETSDKAESPLETHDTPQGERKPERNARVSNAGIVGILGPIAEERGGESMDDAQWAYGWRKHGQAR